MITLISLLKKTLTLLLGIVSLNSYAAQSIVMTNLHLDKQEQEVLWAIELLAKHPLYTKYKANFRLEEFREVWTSFFQAVRNYKKAQYNLHQNNNETNDRSFQQLQETLKNTKSHLRISKALLDSWFNFYDFTTLDKDYKTLNDVRVTFISENLGSTIKFILETFPNEKTKQVIEKFLSHSGVTPETIINSNYNTIPIFNNFNNAFLEKRLNLLIFLRSIHEHLSSYETDPNIPDHIHVLYELGLFYFMRQLNYTDYFYSNQAKLDFSNLNRWQDFMSAINKIETE